MATTSLQDSMESKSKLRVHVQAADNGNHADKRQEYASRACNILPDMLEYACTDYALRHAADIRQEKLLLHLHTYGSISHQIIAITVSTSCSPKALFPGLCCYDFMCYAFMYQHMRMIGKILAPAVSMTICDFVCHGFM